MIMLHLAVVKLDAHVTARCVAACRIRTAMIGMTLLRAFIVLQLCHSLRPLIASRVRTARSKQPPDSCGAAAATFQTAHIIGSAARRALRGSRRPAQPNLPLPLPRRCSPRRPAQPNLPLPLLPTAACSAESAAAPSAHGGLLSRICRCAFCAAAGPCQQAAGEGLGIGPTETSQAPPAARRTNRYKLFVQSYTEASYSPRLELILSR